MANRVAAGFTIASVPLILAVPALQAGNVCLAVVFFVVSGVVMLGTLAPRLPLLHRIPGVGALTPPAVRFHIEGHGGMTVHSPGPVRIILCAGFDLESNRHEITNATVNAYLVGSTAIRRCHQDGTARVSGGNMLVGPDAPYWATKVDLPPGAFVMYFAVKLPGPGEYPVFLKLRASEFYRRDDEVYRDTVRVFPGV